MVIDEGKGIDANGIKIKHFLLETGTGLVAICGNSWGCEGDFWGLDWFVRKRRIGFGGKRRKVEVLRGRK